MAGAHFAPIFWATARSPESGPPPSQRETNGPESPIPESGQQSVAQYLGSISMCAREKMKPIFAILMSWLPNPHPLRLAMLGGPLGHIRAAEPASCPLTRVSLSRSLEQLLYRRVSGVKCIQRCCTRPHELVWLSDAFSASFVQLAVTLPTAHSGPEHLQ